MKFVLDGAYLGADTTAPFSWPVSTSAGPHTLKIRVRLQGGSEVIRESSFTATGNDQPADPDVKPSPSEPVDDSAVPTVAPTTAPDATERPAGPETVSGRFTNASGRAVAGVRVRVEAIDAVADDGSDTALPLVGTTVTGADGVWSLTLPAELPAPLKALSDANGGVLNLVASAAGEAAGTDVPMSASDFLAAGADLGAAPASEQSITSAADDHTIAFHVTNATVEAAPPSEAQTSKSKAVQIAQDETVPSSDAQVDTWQATTGQDAAGYNPDIVAGRDLGDAEIEPQGYGCKDTWKTLKSTVAYTTVGEAHASYDAKASYEYSEKEASTTSVAVSVDLGKHFTLSGSTVHEKNFGRTTGFTNQGPNFAKEWRIPIDYKYMRKTSQCGGPGNIRYFHTDYIKGSGYKIAPGGYTGVYGKDVLHLDGPNAYSKSPVANRAIVARSSFFALTSGRSHTYKGAATVFGVTIEASSKHDKDHVQRISAGSGKYDHYIWGKNGPVNRNPGVFYSY